MNFQNLHRALLVIFCHLLHYRTSPLTSIHLLTLYSLIHQIYTLKNTMTPSLIASAWSYIQSSFKRPYSTEATTKRPERQPWPAVDATLDPNDGRVSRESCPSDIEGKLQADKKISSVDYGKSHSSPICIPSIGNGQIKDSFLVFEDSCSRTVDPSIEDSYSIRGNSSSPLSSLGASFENDHQRTKASLDWHFSSTFMPSMGRSHEDLTATYGAMKLPFKTAPIPVTSLMTDEDFIISLEGDTFDSASPMAVTQIPLHPPSPTMADHQTCHRVFIQRRSQSPPLAELPQGVGIKELQN